MKEGAYITIQSWMVNKLGISGNELICYAIIFGFSQDGDSEFRGSQGYIASCLNMTRENARKVLERLTEKGLISKREEVISGVKFCRYSAIVPTMEGEMKQSIPSAETEHDNNSNTIDNKEEKDKSFSKKEVKTRNKYDEQFEKCWKEYGRKGNKSEAYKVWIKLSEEDRLKVLPHIKAYIQSRSEKSYQKDFERYLSKRVFNSVVYKGNIIIFDPERENANDNEYRPQLDGFNLHWNEQTKCYISMYDISMLADGYTDENRPSSAMVMKGGIRYKWNTQTKQWEAQ